MPKSHAMTGRKPSYGTCGRVRAAYRPLVIVTVHVGSGSSHLWSGHGILVMVEFGTIGIGCLFMIYTAANLLPKHHAQTTEACYSTETGTVHVHCYLAV